jgi:hypothetical protein
MASNVSRIRLSLVWLLAQRVPQTRAISRCTPENAAKARLGGGAEGIRTAGLIRLNVQFYRRCGQPFQSELFQVTFAEQKRKRDRRFEFPLLHQRVTANRRSAFMPSPFAHSESEWRDRLCCCHCYLVDHDGAGEMSFEGSTICSRRNRQMPASFCSSRAAAAMS